MAITETGELRARIEQGLKKDDTPYIQEIGNILTEDAIKDGVGFGLVKDIDALPRVNDLLGVDAALQDDSLKVISVAIRTEVSTAVAGSLINFVQEHGVTETLPLIQANEWGSVTFAKLWSHIAVGNVVELPGDKGEVDATKPVISFGAVASYTIAQQKKFAALYHDVLPEYGKQDATKYTRPDEAKFPAIAFKRYIDSTQTDAGVPIIGTGMAVGPHTGSFFDVHGASVGTRFVLKNGHLVRPKRY